MHDFKNLGHIWQRIRDGIGAMQSLSSAFTAQKHFERRSPEAPEKMLIAHGVENSLLTASVKEWQEIAHAYGIESGKLRPEDRVTDIVKTDWFGDRGLMIEARLTDLGVKQIPKDMTILQLIMLLSSPRGVNRGRITSD